MRLKNIKKTATFFALVICSSPSFSQFAPGPEYYIQPALSAINLLPAYNAGLSGAGVRVGVVDTGINPNHVEFTNAIVAGYNAVTGISGTSNFSSFLKDYHGHGTHVASIAAGRLDGVIRPGNMQGVAYNASLVIGAVSFAAKDGDVVSAYLASSLDYVSSHGAKVINNSWGSGDGFQTPLENYQAFLREDPKILAAIKRALDRGSVLVFAAGNNSEPGNVALNPTNPAILPSFDSGIASKGGIIVAAASSSDGKTLAVYSNRCGIAKEYCIVAPGGSGVEGDSVSNTYILGAYGGAGYGNAAYVYMAGTSMASPMISGAVAIVTEQFPWMINKNLATTILTTGTRAAIPDAEWGRGLLDVGKAIKGPGLFEENFEANVPHGYAPVFSNDIGYRTGMDGGLIKLGAGTLTLTGTDTYTGQTLVKAGTLVVNGSLVSPVMVAGAGTLRGTGNLSGALTVNGTLAPGNTIGTLTVNNVTMNTGSQYQLEIAPGAINTYSNLVATQSATLKDNANIFINASSHTLNTSNGLKDIISAGSTLTVDGNINVLNNSLIYNFGAVKDGNTIDITIANATTKVQDAITHMHNRSALGAARVIDNAIIKNPTGSLVEVMTQGFTTGQEAQLSNAVSQTLPLLNGGASLVAQSALSNINGIVQNRLDGVRSTGLSSGDPVLSDKNMWVKPFGSWSRQQDRHGVTGYSSGTAGIVFGADAAISPINRLGLAFAYAQSDVSSNSSIARQSADVKMFQLLGYGSNQINSDTELNFQVGVGQNSTEGNRSIAFASGNAKSKYYSPTFRAGAGVEKTFKFNETTSFSPSIRADYTYIKDRAYQESGAAPIAPLLLNVTSRSVNELVLGLNGKISHNLNDQNTFSVNAGVGCDVLNRNASITAAYTGEPGAAFSTQGIDQSRWQGRLGLGFVNNSNRNVEVTARYDAELRTGFVNQSASVKVSWAIE